jgi:CHAT domain-containing protein
MAKDTTYLFIVRADFDSPVVIEIQRSRDQVRSYVTENFSLIEKDERASLYSAVKALDLDEWQEQFAPFVQPIIPFAEEGDIVCIVPHDVLHYVPLHAVSVEGNYLIERNPVVYTPNASVMKYCQAKRKGRREKILVFGDSDSERPLPNAREEALEIAELFGTKPYLGGDARKSLVKEKLEKEREEIDILHFACHGYFNAYRPLKSGILFAPEPDEEEPDEFEMALRGLSIRRFLTAEEIFAMELRADLVTLSADESGVSEIRSGDEMVGLTRAFIYAGTPSLVTSLWDVADISTEFFMVHFYERLKAGDTKVEALQKAQLYVKALTAGEVKAYYENKLQKLDQNGDEGRRKQIEINIRSIYGKLLNAEEREGRPVGFDYPIFNHPFYWAPFILVGDWK